MSDRVAVALAVINWLEAVSTLTGATPAAIWNIARERFIEQYSENTQREFKVGDELRLKDYMGTIEDRTVLTLTKITNISGVSTWVQLDDGLEWLAQDLEGLLDE